MKVFYSLVFTLLSLAAANVYANCHYDLYVRNYTNSPIYVTYLNSSKQIAVCESNGSSKASLNATRIEPPKLISMPTPQGNKQQMIPESVHLHCDQGGGHASTNTINIYADNGKTLACSATVTTTCYDGEGFGQATFFWGANIVSQKKGSCSIDSINTYSVKGPVNVNVR